MRTIILAAGQAFKLDGYNKLLLRDPRSGEKIIDQYFKIFDKTEITIVVGYKAIEVMQRFPHLHYVYNPDWKITNNSYSLGLALNEEPCYVVSCDIFMDPKIIKLLEDAEPNCILTENGENRQLNSLNCSVLKNRQIVEIYQGALRSKKDPEAIGVYKISDSKILREWKKKCVQHTNLFIGQNLPFEICPIYPVDKGNYRFEEINTVLDYLRIIENK